MLRTRGPVAGVIFYFYFVVFLLFFVRGPSHSPTVRPPHGKATRAHKGKFAKPPRRDPSARPTGDQDLQTHARCTRFYFDSTCRVRECSRTLYVVPIFGGGARNLSDRGCCPTNFPREKTPKCGSWLGGLLRESREENNLRESPEFQELVGTSSGGNLSDRYRGPTNFDPPYPSPLWGVRNLSDRVSGPTNITPKAPKIWPGETLHTYEDQEKKTTSQRAAHFGPFPMLLFPG